jgi:hypothetical protein
MAMRQTEGRTKKAMKGQPRWVRTVIRLALGATVLALALAEAFPDQVLDTPPITADGRTS